MPLSTGYPVRQKKGPGGMNSPLAVLARCTNNGLFIAKGGAGNIGSWFLRFSGNVQDLQRPATDPLIGQAAEVARKYRAVAEAYKELEEALREFNTLKKGERNG